MPVPVLFAAIGNPLMLWGLAGASLPLIIHMLNRRKFREERWAAMRFLLAAIKKNQKRIRIEQWLLLLIRTALVACLALAMARPALEAVGALGGLAGRKHWVIALDGSGSMGHATSDQSRFDQARAVARRLVRDARPGDAFSLVILGDPPRTVVGAPAFAKDAVLATLDEQKPGDGGLDVAAGFEAIDATLVASDIARKEVLILTDLQANGWRSAGAGSDERRLGAITRWDAKRAHCQVVDVGQSDAGNRTVARLEVQPAIATAGAGLAIRAKVQAFGTPFPAARARLVVDGRLMAAEAQDVPALPSGGSADVEFRHEFPAPGDHLVEVRIDGDQLPLDDRRRAVVGVREAIEVLLVEGAPEAGPFRNETAFLAEALSPEPESPGQPSPIRVRVASEAQWARTDLTAFDAVVLCNVPRVGREAATALDGLLGLGGGVVIFTGDSVQPEAYNRVLFEGGKGLLPAEIVGTAGDPTNRENPYFFDTLAFRHPIVADFAGQPDRVVASLTQVKTFRYHRLSLPKDAPARVALRVGDDPLIVESARGRGRVILVATSADREWTDWPIHHSYPAVMEKLILEAAANRFADRNLTVGRPIEAILPGNAAGSDATIVYPDRDEAMREEAVRRESVPIERAGTLARLQSAPTMHAGSYRVEFGPPLGRVERFAANPPLEESDLLKLDLAGLRAAIPGWSFDYDNDWKPLERSAAGLRRRGELHRPLLWAVLGLLLVETVLAWRFGRGGRR